MNKRISFILTSAALAALTLTAFAQGNANAGKGPGAQPIIHTDEKLVGKKVTLAATLGGASEFPTITITNNVSASIPAGAKLYWRVNDAMQGSYTLPHMLYKGMSVHFDTEARGGGGAPTAWYFK